MTEQPKGSASLDARLARVLGSFGDGAIQPFDALAVAERSIRLEGRRRSRQSWTLLSAAAVVALLVLLALGAMGGGGRLAPDSLGIDTRPTGTAAARPSDAATAVAGHSSPDAAAASQPAPAERAYLQGTWIRSDRPAERLVIAGSSARIVDAQGATLLEETFLIDSGVLTILEGSAATPDCSTHPILQYVFRVNPTHNGFFMRPYMGQATDPCSTREDALAATWTLVSVP